MSYKAMVMSPCGEYESHGKSGFRTEAAARAYLAAEFARSSEITDATIYELPPGADDFVSELGHLDTSRVICLSRKDFQ